MPESALHGPVLSMLARVHPFDFTYVLRRSNSGTVLPNARIRFSAGRLLGLLYDAGSQKLLAILDAISSNAN